MAGSEIRGTSGFIRSNILGLVAIFIALAGTAIALPGKNKVDSGDIKNGQVRAKDLAADSVSSANVASDSLTGADIDESSLSGLGGGVGGGASSAGGDLAGTYPNPMVKEAALDLGGELGGTVADAAVDEAALGLGGDLSGTVANAQIKPGIVGPLKLGDNAVVGGPGGDVQDETLTGADIQNGSVNADDIDETNLDAATVNGLEVLGPTTAVTLNGMTFSVQCFTDPTNGVVAMLDSAVDNSKGYVEISGAAPQFGSDLDAADPALATTTAATSGIARAYFLNGATGEVVSVDFGWREDFASCPTVERIGRAIG